MAQRPTISPLGALASLFFSEVRHWSSDEYTAGGISIGLQTRSSLGLHESKIITAVVAGSIFEVPDVGYLLTLNRDDES